MDITSGFFFSEFSRQTASEFCIQSEQDGLFFGLDFLRDFLKENDQTAEFIAYLQEGECVFKGQTLLKVNLKDNLFKKEDILSLVSYLSGAYTLLSCFTERNFDFAIAACSTPGFSFSGWEEKAILKAGAVVQKPEETVYCSNEEVRQALERGNKQIVLSTLKMSKEQIKNLLKSFPSFKECSLQGDFLPFDLEEFRSFRLKSVYPLCLQGCFPRLKVKLVEI